MSNWKECPQCGEEFQGRQNKIYCSDKCKMDAFITGKTKSLSETSNLENAMENQLDSSELLQLQIELKKLEMQKELELAEIRRAEKADEYEYSGNQLAKQYQAQEDLLKSQIAQLEEKLNQIEKNSLEQQQKLIQQINAKKQATENPQIPASLQEIFVEVLETLLENEEVTLYKKALQTAQAQTNKLMTKIRKAVHPYHSKLPEYQMLIEVENLIEEYIEEINQKDFWAVKRIVFILPDDLRSKMEDYLAKLDKR
jgi:carboxypeptidase C (cathepsin A)